MNYFELFEMPVSLNPDRELVRKKYMELSRLHHPDYFANASAGEQQAALEMSASLNKAFKILSNRDETIRYVLQMKGVLEEEEKYQLPPSFLMQMLEVNEALAEAEMDGDPGQKTRIGQELVDMEKELYEPVRGIIENYRDDSASPEAMLLVKDYYFKKKYLHRLSDQLGRMS